MKKYIHPALSAGLLLGALGVSGCVTQRAEYISAEMSATGAPVSSRAEKAVVEAQLSAEMEAAWRAAQQATEQGDGTVLMARRGMEIISPNNDMVPTPSHADFWGTPPEAGEGDGVTLIDSELRHQLADALEKTPQGGMARWAWQNSQFMFMPNSDIYYAQHSGGRCRDGVFVMYDSREQTRKRGLFCQKAPGSSWFLIQE